MKKLLYILFIVCLFLPGAVKGFVFSAEEKLDIKTTVELSVDVMLEKAENDLLNIDSLNLVALGHYHRIHLLIAGKDKDVKGTLISTLDFLTDIAEVPTGNIPSYLERMYQEEQVVRYSHLKQSAVRFLEMNSTVPDSINTALLNIENEWMTKECHAKTKQVKTYLRMFKGPIRIDSVRTIIYLGDDNKLASPLGGSFKDMYHSMSKDRTYKMCFHPIDKVWKFHHTDDIPAKEGFRVKSAIKGKVVDIGYHADLGNFVKIYDETTGFTNRQLHFSKILVKEGQYIKAGDPIGKCGSTGKATGPHIHNEFWFEGETVNPFLLYRLSESELQAVVIKNNPKDPHSQRTIDMDFDLSEDNLLKILPALIEQHQIAICQAQVVTAE